MIGIPEKQKKNAKIWCYKRRELKTYDINSVMLYKQITREAQVEFENFHWKLNTKEIVDAGDKKNTLCYVSVNE